jgi:hypothetical protein
MIAAEALLPLLDGVKTTHTGWVARCPAHQDDSPSLTIRQADDRVLIHCFSGCEPAEICRALGLKLRHLFDGNGKDFRPDPVVTRRRRINHDFEKWRSDEILKTALELRTRDNWLLAIAAGVDLGLLTADEADHWRGIQFDGYSFLEWKFETLRTGDVSQALEIYRER